MYFLLACATLVAGGAIAVALAIVGRWLAARPFGERSFRDAYRTSVSGSPSMAVSLARATGGVVGWYLASSLLFGCAVFSSGDVRTDDVSMRVHVATGGPADRAGVRDGDRVIAVDGVEVHDWDALKRAVASHANEKLRLDVERDGQALTLEAIPEGAPAKILVGPAVEKVNVGLGSAIATGVVTPAKIVVTMVRGIVRTFYVSEKPELSGPVGIVRETEAAQRSGFATAAKLVALLVAYVLPYMAVGSLIIAVFTSARRRRAAKPGR
jgi:membrane-associated protease RseP (regulator of RpoE activity)